MEQHNSNFVKCLSKISFEPALHHNHSDAPQCDSRTLYGCWRVFWAAYHVTWVLLSWVMEPWAAYSSSDRVKWFIYLTNWTYLLLTLETVLEAVNFCCVHALREDIVEGELQFSHI